MILYEDRADVCLAGAKDVPADLRVMGWHGQANRHNMMFLDGHAANPYVAFKKVMDHNERSTGGINYFCNPNTEHCLNGTIFPKRTPDGTPSRCPKCQWAP